MSSRKGRQSRSSIDNVLDDLLGSDSEVTAKRAPVSKPKEVKSKAVKQVKLTSDASDAEFYKNLKSLGGSERQAESSEDEELSDDAAKKIVDDIGDLDDLDDDLFAGFSGLKKTPVKKKNEQNQKTFSKQKSNTHNTTNYDSDDPLAGLGLSEDEDVSVTKKKSSPPKKKLTRRLSGDKMRVQPRKSSGDDTEVYRSPSLDIHEDPFLTLNAREGKPNKKQSSFDETASEQEISPRQSTEKQSRHKSRRKVSVEPTPPDVSESKNESDPTLQRRSSESRQKNSSKKIADDDDFFGDSDGLPGLSDEESPPQKEVARRKSDDDDIPATKASSALDNLLAGSSSVEKAKKSKEPTMLEQIISGKVKKVEAVKEEPPLKDELQFGGYSPSVNISNNRPITAPNSRSVRFADDLGLNLDDSFTRPSSAPEKKKLQRNKNKNLSVDLESSPDESNSEWLLNAKKKGHKNEKIRKEEPKEVKKQIKRQSSKDDWLGLGEDLTDQLVSSKSNELFSPRRKPSADTIAGDTNKAKNKPVETDIDLSLPWESSPNKPKVGRRQSATIESPLQPENRKMETNDNEITLGVKENDEFLSLFKKKKTANAERRKSIEPDNHFQPDISTSSKTAVPSTPPNATHNDAVNSSLLQPQHAHNTIQQTHSSPHILMQPQQMQYQYQPIMMSPDLQNIQLIRAELQKDLEKQQQEEFNATKRQFERDKSYLESELRELQEKVMKIEDVKSSTITDYSSRFKEMENKVRRLELERDQLMMSQESLKQRHKDELTALEVSHKNRTGFLEESYQRRESQLKEEAGITKSHVDEKIKSLYKEKEDLVAGFKKKTELMEKNKLSELERLKELHKNSLDELMNEQIAQIEHMRMLKEQEVAAAVNAFSHTKSLQSLITEVQNSTREVSQLQSKIGASHYSKLEDRELTLKSKDEYLRKLEARLQQQEVSNNAERERLQSLVSKLEVQLREQTRQIEQDKWKLNQDDNRLKAMQNAFEEERRITSEQLMRERQQLTKAREDMLAEQRKVVTECYEEKRRIANERVQLTELQRETIEKSRHDRSSTLQAESELEATLTRYQHESSTFNTRLAKVKEEELKLLAEKEEFVKEQKLLTDEFDRLNMAGRELQERSKEIDDFAVEAKRVHEEGLRALDEARITQAEYLDAKNQQEVKELALQSQDSAIQQEKERLASERYALVHDKQLNRCDLCKQSKPDAYNMYPSQRNEAPFNVNSIPEQNFPNQVAHHNGYITHQNKQVISHHLSPYKKARRLDHNNNVLTSTPTNTGLDFTQDSLQSTENKPNVTFNNASDSFHASAHPPPDLLMNEFEFKRALRRWSTAKEKDDDFFEEETKFLKSLERKRLR